MAMLRLSLDLVMAPYPKRLIRVIYFHANGPCVCVILSPVCMTREAYRVRESLMRPRLNSYDAPA